MAYRRLDQRRADRRIQVTGTRPPSRGARHATPEGGRRLAWTRIVRSRADAIASRLSAPAAGALAAAWTAVIGLLVVGLVVMGGWVAGAGEGDVTPALKVVGLAWLATHHIAIDLDAGSISAEAIGLMVLPGILLWRAGTWAARRSGACEWRDVRVTVAFASGVYGTIGMFVAGISHLPAAGVGAPAALLGTGLFALVAFGGGASREAGVWPTIAERFPANFRRWVRAAAGALLSLACGVAALIAVSLALNFSSVDRMTASLNPGVLGGILLLVLEAAYLPNVIMWGFGYVSGVGFAVGDSTWIGPGDALGGALPAFPLFGAVPPTGSPWLMGVLALPVASGVISAMLLNRREPGSIRSGHAWRERAWVALLVAVPVFLLAAFSGGALGTGRLSSMGPPALLTALAVAGLVTTGSVLADMSRSVIRRGRFRTRAARRQAEQARS